MSNTILGMVWIACIGATSAQTDYGRLVKAQHERDDQEWARKSGLPAGDVRAIRMFEGMTDTTPGVIRNLDAESLKARQHILLVEALGGACTRVHVLQRKDDGFAEVWTLTRLPHHIWGVTEGPQSGTGCLAGTAHATPDGGIVLEVRVHNDPFQRTIPTDTYVFQWKGSKYELTGGEH
jgi:hypothetical protein